MRLDAEKLKLSIRESGDAYILAKGMPIQGVANAATTKAAWAIVDALHERHEPGSCWRNCAWELEDALKHIGIARPQLR